MAAGRECFVLGEEQKSLFFVVYNGHPVRLVLNTALDWKKIFNIRLKM